jgi:isopenicillin N synthase-like dioxygenase
MGSISETPLVEIPIIDISGYLAGDPEAKKKAASEFRSACENQGFLQVVGHSVPPDVQERFLSAIARFFALPLSEKTKVSQEKSKCYRGYERIGGQKLDELDTSATPDQKEGFSVRPERALGRFLQGPNQWPEDLPGFKAAYMEYFNSVHQLSKSVFRLMALSLDLPEDHFDAFASDPDGKLPLKATGALNYLNAHPMLLTLRVFKDCVYVDLTIILLHHRTWRAGLGELVLTLTSVP